MDGYELAAKLRKQRNLRRTLFVALSGFQRRTPKGKSGDHFDHYFVKPVDPAQLLSFLDTHAHAGAAKPATARRLTARPNPLRVLLVEDHADLAAMTAAVLRREGLEVQTALTGQEALKTATDFRPQLVLCDLNLPGMKGREVVRGLRSSRATRRSYLVMLSGLAEAETKAFSHSGDKP